MKNGKTIELKNLLSRDIYYHIFYPQKPPSCIEKWNNIFNKKLEWQSIFRKIFVHKLVDRKRIDFHWKVIHRAIYTEHRLQKMGQSNGLCKICNQNDETLCHLIFDCSHAKNVWKNIEVYIMNKCGRTINLTKEVVLFGISVNDKELDIIINLLIYETKWQIWKNRNCVKYGNKIALSYRQIFQNVLNEIKLMIGIISKNVLLNKCSLEILCNAVN